MIEKIYYYFVENSTLPDEYNRKLMTMLGTITIGIDHTFTFKDKKLVLDIDPYKRRINKMSKKELVEELIYIFDYAPVWVYNDFVKRNDING